MKRHVLLALLLLTGACDGEEGKDTSDAQGDDDDAGDDDDDAGGDDDDGAVSEDEFAALFVEKYCDDWDACADASGPCPVSVDDDANEDCDYDAAAAESCLAADFVCGTFGVEVATVCNEVC